MSPAPGAPQPQRLPPQVPCRVLGRTGLLLTTLSFGGGPLGSMPEAFHYEVPFERAVATVRRILAGPVNHLDTAASYGDGESERRIGAALAEGVGRFDEGCQAGTSAPAGGLVLATKVDRDLVTGDFDGDQVRRSMERSLRLLGVDRLPLVHLHDPEHLGFEAAMAPRGPVEALLRLRDEGVAGHVGVAGGPVDLMRRFLRTGAFDALITHNRWTLVDRSAGTLIDEAGELGVGVLNAAVFGGGLLVRGTAASSRYAYGEAPAPVLDRVRRIERLCARHGVSLGAVALQFSLRDPRITSSIVGVSTPEHVDEVLRLVGTPVPEPLWDEVARLAAPVEHWLH